MKAWASSPLSCLCVCVLIVTFVFFCSAFAAAPCTCAPCASVRSRANKCRPHSAQENPPQPPPPPPPSISSGESSKCLCSVGKCAKSREASRVCAMPCTAASAPRAACSAGGTWDPIPIPTAPGADPGPGPLVKLERWLLLLLWLSSHLRAAHASHTALSC
ncbi:hypothetical protein B484DRAFT_457577 [Ochromonadaceae sp. CCMP2298]|nr:hypothetical protein B484DRAFT_457577 [Ochromonadaceae sp. CCMP2298]